MVLFSKQIKDFLGKVVLCHKEIFHEFKEGTVKNDSLGADQYVMINMTSFDNISSSLFKLAEFDVVIEKLRSNNLLIMSSDAIKKNLAGIKRLIIENSNKISRDIKKISLILQEYKERCRINLLEFLKALDLDLRKALKPLVPNQVLQEQLKFKPINPEPGLSSSINSSPPEEENSARNTEDRLNNHIQLLITTLEGVAKDLIAITQNANQKYYEVVDPLVLYSEPPSPLAAPLPDYFSYDLANMPEENCDFSRAPISISEATKKRLLEKFNKIEKGHDTSCNPKTAGRIQEKLQKLFREDIKELDLMEIFREEGMPMSEREKIVFEMINTYRPNGRDVSLEDIIHANEIDSGNPNFEVSRNNYSQILKNIQGKDLTDRFEDLEEFSSLQSSIDEKFMKNPSRVALSTKKSSLLPPISLTRTKSKKPLREESKPTLKNIKLRSSTPNKLVSKPNMKRSHTPGLKKKKKT